MLDDPTFGILNGFVFFNQVDIINHIQNNSTFLRQLFSWFSDNPSLSTSEPGVDLDEKKKDAVLFLHQLMLMGKGIQIPSRLALYRALIDQGLFNAIEWSFRITPETEHKQIIHAAAEILTLVTEHDVNAVRTHILREVQQGGGKRTLVDEVVGLMGRTENSGLGAGLADGIRCLIDAGGELRGAMCSEQALGGWNSRGHRARCGLVRS
jgi:protein phosphatase-4 regulatory subunit 3